MMTIIKNDQNMYQQHSSLLFIFNDYYYIITVIKLKVLKELTYNDQYIKQSSLNNFNDSSII